MNPFEKRLKVRRETLMAEGEGIFKAAGEADLTDEQRERVDAINAELDEIKGDLARFERQRRDELEAPVLERAARVGEKERGFNSLGEQLQAIANSVRGGELDPRLRNLRAAQGLNEGVGSEGGFLVQTDFLPGIYKRIYERGQVLTRTRRRPLTSNANKMVLNAIDETSRATGSRHGGIQGYWLAEAAAKTKSKPSFRRMELNLNKNAVLYYATDEVLGDAGTLTAEVSEAVSDEMIFMVEDAIFRGTGAGQPLGILNSSALVSVAKEGSQAATTIVKENVFKMWSRLYAPSQANAVWFANQDIQPQLYGMTLGDQGIYFPAGTFANNTGFATLFGRPVIFVEYAETLGTKGDLMLLDLNQYMLAEKGGIQQAMSIHVAFTTDETVFRFVARWDGQPLWSAALTPYKGSSTVSPFISLDTRA